MSSARKIRGHARLTGMTGPRRATLDDLAELWDRGIPAELIDGEIVHETGPRPEHGAAQAKLLGLLDPFHRKPGGPRGPGGWWLMVEVDVFYDDRNVYRHDAMGFRRERLAARPTKHPVRDRPDWACEILSPSTTRNDVVRKQRTLHRHGVPHYWLIDPSHETLVVMRHGPEGYVNVLTAMVGDQVRAEPFGDVEIDVGELFGHG